MTQQTVADVMTPAPTTVDSTETIQEAARLMAQEDVGVLVVRSGPTATGVVTDRDLVVRGLGAGLGADATVGQVASEQVATVGITDPVETAVEVMRAAAVRRAPVLDGNVLVGIVSIGDLAIERDPTSALADISRAEPNR
ncbi:CBS domain-containing protein [Promicromonospora thailandica]|uniref:CBS domain-containing protein n=1 Tax=Promicromonospora thailandica TaxID=765201 RepID=A0A9X2G7F5_9MICO|nr:CBS domain-containing protein [Promicromonospora thailandica]MCP2267020.1 CBS domain-containing protein [Promicromonospora thailandica]BFF16699.1 CBS domain-containing protein [Promicromonospora thailandica]